MNQPIVWWEFEFLGTQRFWFARNFKNQVKIVHFCLWIDWTYKYKLDHCKLWKGGKWFDSGEGQHSVWSCTLCVWERERVCVHSVLAVWRQKEQSESRARDQSKRAGPRTTWESRVRSKKDWEQSEVMKRLKARLRSKAECAQKEKWQGRLWKLTRHARQQKN